MGTKYQIRPDETPCMTLAFPIRKLPKLDVARYGATLPSSTPIVTSPAVGRISTNEIATVFDIVNMAREKPKPRAATKDGPANWNRAPRFPLCQAESVNMLFTALTSPLTISPTMTENIDSRMTERNFPTIILLRPDVMLNVIIPVRWDISEVTNIIITIGIEIINGAMKAVAILSNDTRTFSSGRVEAIAKREHITKVPPRKYLIDLVDSIL
jgi:hypothetical protein